MSEQPVFDPQPGQPVQPEQPQVQPEQAAAVPDGGAQPVGGAQVSSSADVPRMTTYDDEGRPHTVRLDPQSGAPMEDSSGQ